MKIGKFVDLVCNNGLNLFLEIEIERGIDFKAPLTDKSFTKLSHKKILDIHDEVGSEDIGCWRGERESFVKGIRVF